jgi:hypothetical protein
VRGDDVKKLASFLVCLLAIGGLGTLDNACSSSGIVRPGDDSGGGEESGADTGSSGSSSSGSDATTSSSGSDASSSGSGSEWDSAGGGSGSSSGCPPGSGVGCYQPFDAPFYCGPDAAATSPNTSSPCCDECIEDCCAPAWCTCSGDSGFDDAGQPTGCFAFVACVQICLVPPADSGVDGGTPMTCAQQCGASYSTGQVQEGSQLLSCISINCAPPSLCGQ